jgi:serine/threonine protein kinase
MTTAPGSVRWSARELVQSDDSDTVLSTATDSWSFGMLSLEILTGEQPFAHVSTIKLFYLTLADRTLDPP